MTMVGSGRWNFFPGECRSASGCLEIFQPLSRSGWKLYFVSLVVFLLALAAMQLLVTLCANFQPLLCRFSALRNLFLAVWKCDF